MNCINPLVGVPYYGLDKAFKRVFKYRVVGSAKKLYHKESSGLLSDLLSRQSESLLGTKLYDPFGEVAHPILIPCGHCMACRLEYSRQWSLRLCLEKIHHRSDHCWFLTLTYDDDHVPKTEKGIETLRIQDVSDFMKRLRALMLDYYRLDGIRFYAGSEYGDHTFRPHYHLILYGCPIPDLKLYAEHEQDQSRYAYFQSKMLDKLWSHGKVIVGEVEFESCSYVARYVTKKVSGKDYEENYKPFGIEQESSRMSRNPGIGAFFFDPEIYGQIEKAVGPGRIFKRCSAFDRYMKDANPVILHELKLEAQKIVDLRLRADPCSRSYVAKLEADEAELLQNFSKKGQF